MKQTMLMINTGDIYFLIQASLKDYLEEIEQVKVDDTNELIEEIITNCLRITIKSLGLKLKYTERHFTNEDFVDGADFFSDYEKSGYFEEVKDIVLKWFYETIKLHYNILILSKKIRVVIHNYDMILFINHASKWS